MTNAELIDKLLIGTYTKTDAIRRIRSLHQFLENQLFASRISEFTASSSADVAWLSGLGADFMKEFTTENMYLKVEDLDTQIKKIQALIIYLPFEVPQGEVVRLGLRMRKDFGANFLLEFRFDPTLIAGCALVWNNIYKDYSVKKKINLNKEIILTSIREYLAEQNRV
ncbi:MAG: hypothetical protein Q7S88_03785 [Candidatus Daviesbacteria bacterium]|nr:hypothetical protein [Candidatus Daviesbacteria bacterium]